MGDAKPSRRAQAHHAVRPRPSAHRDRAHRGGPSLKHNRRFFSLACFVSLDAALESGVVHAGRRYPHEALLECMDHQFGLNGAGGVWAQSACGGSRPSAMPLPAVHPCIEFVKQSALKGPIIGVKSLIMSTAPRFDPSPGSHFENLAQSLSFAGDGAAGQCA
jgi:hypothetical protein